MTTVDDNDGGRGGERECGSIRAWMQESMDREEIRRLIMEYAYRLDEGDLKGFAELFRHGCWAGYSGYDEVLAWCEQHIILYEGRTGTHHLVGNVTIDIDENGVDATARSYIQLFHCRPQVAAVETLGGGLYLDVFEKVEGRWLFRDRKIDVRLQGDLSHHLRHSRSEA